MGGSRRAGGASRGGIVTPDDPTWSRVDRYLESELVQPDDALHDNLVASAAAGLPSIQVSAPQGKFLELLARAIGARRILEIGTLGGYSATWLARGLPPDGWLLSLELVSRYAEVARGNLARAGVTDRVEIRVGPALASLAEISKRGEGPFDLVFIDADKPNNPGYVRWAVQLTRPGSWLVIDNVVRGGRVADPTDPDPNVRGTREAVAWIAAETRLEATALQTVGGKGYDGFLLARVRTPA